MSFKIHLIIISVIIVMVFLVWSMSGSEPPPPAPVPVAQKVSSYSIAISHASWGLNCAKRPVSVNNSTSSYDTFAGTDVASKFHEDNVLLKVSEICNGKLQCDIPFTPDILGDDPQPDCDKVLDIEYRCFSYDRPWRVRSSSGSLSINCDRPEQ